MAANTRIVAGFSLRRSHFAGSALALVLAAQLCTPARADSECGDGSSGTVVCDASNNPYPNGISYSPANSLTLTTNADTLVNGTISVQTGGDTVVNHLGTVDAINGAAGQPGILVYGDSSATITGSGSVRTYADNSIGVLAASLGNVAVTVGPVTTGGAASGGISASSFDGNAGVTAAGVSATGVDSSGNGGIGISADGPTGASVTSSGAISTVGGNAAGVQALGHAGDSIVDVGDISTNGINSSGVVSSTDDGSAGSVNVTTGAITTVGDTAIGVAASANGTGDATVTTGDVSTNGAGAFGVQASSAGGNVSVTTGQVTTLGTNSTGIDAQSAAAGVTVVTGGVATSGVDSNGDGSTGVNVVGAGDVGISSSGAISTIGNNAVAVQALSHTGNINIGVGALSTSGTNASGVSASTDTDSAGSINITTGAITTVGDNAAGVTANANGTGDAVVTTGDISTTGASALGVNGFSAGGNVSVTTGKVATVGDGATGITANANGNGNVTVTTGDLSTDGAGAIGIYGFSGGGNISVTTDKVTTAGIASSGIYLTSNGGAVTVVSGGVATSGVDSDGNGSNAIDVFGAMGVNISSSGPISTLGNNAVGVNALGSAGNAIVNVGDISTNGTNTVGVVADTDNGTTGSVSVTAGNITTVGDNAAGIVARANGTGDVTVTAGDISTNGQYTHGVQAFSASGNVTVTTGSVTMAGQYGSAVDVESSAGAASVTVNGSVYAPRAYFAAYITAPTSATLNIASGGTLVGQIELESLGQNVLNNAGTIAGASFSPTIFATDAGLNFTNTGYFAGSIIINTWAAQVPAFDSHIVNSGTYVAKSLDFGAGSGTFVNSGTFELPTGTGTVQRAIFTGLTSFSNSGVIDLRNGRGGNVLALSGTYVGTGASTLLANVAYAGDANATVTDQLKVTGAITGKTVVFLTPTTSNGTVLGRAVFAQGGAGSSPTAFVLSSTIANTDRLLTQSIDFAPAYNSYSLVTAPVDGVFRMMKLSEAAQQVWYASTDVWLSHIDILRDQMLAGKPQDHPRLWGQAYGQWFKRDDRRDTTVFGAARSMDLSYRQDEYGGQLGSDYGISKIASVGITGGYVNSRLNYSASADRGRINAANIGITATVATPKLFVSVLGKYDHYWVDFDGADEGFHAHLGGSSLGIHGELGGQFHAGRFNFQPIAGVDYVKTSLGDLRAFDDTIDFDKLEGLRLRAGGRVNYTLATSGAKPSIAVYLQGDYVKEFDGTNGSVFSTGSQFAHFSNDRIRPYEAGKIGVTVAAAHNLGGFAEAFGATGSTYKGGGVRVGVTKAF